MTFQPKVTIMADSLHPNGHRFITWKIEFPRCLLAELNTHRQLVRNVASSRAIPNSKLIAKTCENPYIPIITQNKKGMQGEQITNEELLGKFELQWSLALANAVMSSEAIANLGLHKQVVNRLLEPWMIVPVLLSGTDWEHFFNLRDSEFTEPNFAAVAAEMRRQYDKHKPRKLSYHDWHIPFKTDLLKELNFKTRVKVAVARCARVSYLNHEGEISTDKDIALHDSLLANGHMTPFEHIAQAVPTNYDKHSPLTSFLPDILQDTVTNQYVSIEEPKKPKDKILWCRQYRGFYTYRHLIEDNLNETST